jgi:TonB-linked SusC/RagA family outer membrane protein
MKKLLLVSLCFLLLCITQVFAQNRTVTGTVTAKEDGLPIPGATVKVAGTTFGTQTNSAGKFSISVSTGQSLIVSFIGYTSQTIPVGTKSVIDVALSLNSGQLSEVVVSAYGIKQSTRSSANSAQVVTAAELNTVREPNINNALAGKVAGIQVRSQSAAALGRSTEVRLRGASGLGTGSGAIYVVDGTILPNSDDINLDDVENVTVLQGAAAAALFGSQGANGAIVITSKKAKKTNGLGIDLNLGATFDNVYILPNYQNTYAGGNDPNLQQYVWKAGDPDAWKALSGKYYHDYSDDSSWGPKMVGQEYIPWYAWYPGSKYSYKTASLTPQPNNAKDFFNTGVTLNNSVSFNKAGDDYNFRLGYGNVYIKGLIPDQDLKKNTLNLNYNYDINKHLSLSADINYVNQKQDGVILDGYANQTTGSFNSWFHRDLNMGIMKELNGLKSPDGTLATWNHNDPGVYTSANPVSFYGANYWYNFYTYQDLLKDYTNHDRLYGNVALTYKVNNDLSFKATYRKQQNTSYTENIVSSDLQTSAVQTGVKAGYYTQNTYSNRENYEFLATYNKKIKDFTIDANAGTDVFNWTYKDNSVQTNNGLAIPNLYTVNNSVDPATLVNTRTSEKYNAVLGRVALGFKNLLFVDGSLRNDWYSTLPVAQNSILSKSIGGSFIFGDLLKSQSSWLSYGKLRGTWGEIPKALGTTNETFGAYRYPGSAYNVNANKFNGSLLMSSPRQFVDPNITGSTVTQKEVGLDLRFLNDRLGISATYWDGSEKNFPATLTVNGASGFSSILTNFGLIKKSGFDLNLQGTPFRSPNFTWNINATYSNLLEDKVVEISNKYNVKQIIVQYNSFTSFPYMIQQQGMAWGQIYGNGILRNSSGVPILDANGFYKNNPNTYFGSVLPKHTGGMQNSFTIFKDFTINVNIDYQFGGKFASLSDMWGSYSGLTARTAVLNDKGVPIRDAVADGGGVHMVGVDVAGKPVSTYVGAYDYFHNLYNNSTFDPYIYDLTFIKLREVGLAYRIPVKKLGISGFIKNASFQLQARDLWLIYAKTKDFDPSQISAVQGESGQLPGTRGIGFNLRIGF